MVTTSIAWLEHIRTFFGVAVKVDEVGKDARIRRKRQKSRQLKTKKRRLEEDAEEQDDEEEELNDESGDYCLITVVGAGYTNMSKTVC